MEGHENDSGTSTLFNRRGGVGPWYDRIAGNKAWDGGATVIPFISASHGGEPLVNWDDVPVAAR